MFGSFGYFSYLYYVIKDKNMKQTYVTLPDSFYKGLICKVHVSLNGKKATKELKVCMVKARSITFMEVDKVNRQNIFRKVDRTDIVGFSPTAICEITVRDGILPVKWESSWDSIGKVSRMAAGSFQYTPRPNYGSMATAAKGFSHDVLAVSVSNRSTTNSAAGFPMV
jgi:hypothetical protein